MSVRKPGSCYWKGFDIALVCRWVPVYVPGDQAYRDILLQPHKLDDVLLGNLHSNLSLRTRPMRMQDQWHPILDQRSVRTFGTEVAFLDDLGTDRRSTLVFLVLAV